MTGKVTRLDHTTAMTVEQALLILESAKLDVLEPLL